MRQLFPLSVLVLGLTCAVLPTYARAQIPHTTHVYRTVDGVDVEVDVFRNATTETMPVLVWFHGGALLNGTRLASVGWGIKTFCENEGCILAVADYRLGPEAKVAQIADDVVALADWIRSEGPALFNADPDRLVIAGRSAGGYLAQLSGALVSPPPDAVVSYWGYGNILGSWYLEPSSGFGSSISRSAAYAEVYQGGIVTGRGSGTGNPNLQRFYPYLRQNGLWTDELTGLDPANDADQIRPFCPVFNVTPSYPPTFFLHGENDRDVPVSETREMIGALDVAGVTHEEMIVPGAGHGLGGASSGEVTAAREAGIAFMRHYLFDALPPRPGPNPGVDAGVVVPEPDGGTPTSRSDAAVGPGVDAGPRTAPTGAPASDIGGSGCAVGSEPAALPLAFWTTIAFTFACARRRRT